VSFHPICRQSFVIQEPADTNPFIRSSRLSRTIDQPGRSIDTLRGTSSVSRCNDFSQEAAAPVVKIQRLIEDAAAASMCCSI
jgi:hypothetical protein